MKSDLCSFPYLYTNTSVSLALCLWQSAAYSTLSHIRFVIPKRNAQNAQIAVFIFQQLCLIPYVDTKCASRVVHSELL